MLLSCAHRMCADSVLPPWWPRSVVLFKAGRSKLLQQGTVLATDPVLVWEVQVNVRQPPECNLM